MGIRDADFDVVAGGPVFARDDDARGQVHPGRLASNLAHARIVTDDAIDELVKIANENMVFGHADELEVIGNEIANEPHPGGHGFVGRQNCLSHG